MKIFSTLLVYFSILVIIIFSAFVYQTMKGDSHLPLKKITISITSLNKDFKRLEEEKIIKNSFLILKTLTVLNLDKKIKAGTYEFNNHMGIIKVIKKLLKGDEKLIQLTIIDGFDLYDIDHYLYQKKIIDHPRIFFLLANRSSQINKAREILTNPKINSLEGLLYPDTYTVKFSSPLEDLIKNSLNNFKKKIMPHLNQVEKKNWIKFMTIASLIEKETIVELEKPIIAGVVYNRLERRMKLRFDPTIIYALKKENQYQENLKNERINIRKKHFSLPSKFNTYYTWKLPPHPISSFTVTSLLAALNPEKHNYLFFVSKSKKDHSQGHDFSTTYYEHLQKIIQYRKK